MIALINPRYFVETHPFYHLSGVAVAYKLVEAMYITLPDIPRKPLENLLDLVAIGLIADLVKLTGECRYLAQKGQRESGGLDDPEPVMALVAFSCLSIFFAVDIADRSFDVVQCPVASLARSRKWRSWLELIRTGRLWRSGLELTEHGLL